MLTILPVPTTKISADCRRQDDKYRDFGTFNRVLETLLKHLRGAAGKTAMSGVFSSLLMVDKCNQM